MSTSEFSECNPTHQDEFRNVGLLCHYRDERPWGHINRADKPCDVWTDPQEEELCQLQKPHWTLSRLKHTHETFIPFYKKPTLKSILYTEFSRKPTTWWKWRENGSLELKKNTSPLWKLHLYSHVGHTDGHTDAIHLYQFPFVAVAFLITGESIWLLNSLCNCA